MKVGRRLEIDRFLDILGVFAEFEIKLCKGRQIKGFAGAKANRVYASEGSPALIDAVTMPEMKAPAAASL
jgi:DNA invertase Pin-like site-specific DNA recombinase